MTFLLPLIAAIAAAFVHAIPANAVSVQPVVSDMDIEAGDFFTIDLVSSHDTPELTGFETIVHFDEDRLRFADITFPSVFPAFSPQKDRNHPVVDALVSGQRLMAGVFFEMPSGSVPLASLTFEALKPGMAQVTFESTPNGFLLTPSGAVFDQSVTAEVAVSSASQTTVSPTVPAVPLPLSISYLLIGLFALTAAGTKQRRTAA